MARSPSQEWDDDGRLVRRAIATDVTGDPDPGEPKATQPYKHPLPTKDPVPTKGLVDTSKIKRPSATKAVEADEVENKSAGGGAKRTRREYGEYE